MKTLIALLSFVLLAALVCAGTQSSNPSDPPKVTKKLTRWIAAHPQRDTAKVWVYFRDRGFANPGELATALAERKAELTPRALERRALRGTGPLVDERDLPVCSAYRDRVVALSRKHRTDNGVINAVSVEAAVDGLEAIAALDCVTRIDLVVAFHRLEAEPIPCEPPAPAGAGSRGLNYGSSQTQLDQINVPAVHDLGFNGDGVIVCMLDTGFYKDHEALRNLTVLAEWDFINNDPQTQNEAGDDRSQHNHGTYTWSALGGLLSGKLYGPAHGASFLLAKTEDITQEVPIEEDWWSAGIHWAEGLGADVASSSLCYSDWYSFSDMDGKTAVTTIAANWAVSKGVVVCNAMGNRGQYTGAIMAPADSDGVISCGAVDEYGALASFSGSGPTYDGRTKPDVCAMGVYTYCAVTSGTSDYGYVNGTSLSTPLVGGAAALLVDAHPEWTPADVKEALHRTASRATSPDNNYGWGILDCMAALRTTGLSLLDRDVYFLPGAAGGTVNFTLNAGSANAGEVYVLLGTLAGTEPGTLLPSGLATIPLNRDWYTNYILGRLNTAPFTRFYGTLDAAGGGTAVLTLPPIPGYIGSTMHYAYAAGTPLDFVSNAAEIGVVP